jgi:hypothetical protein
MRFGRWLLGIVAGVLAVYIGAVLNNMLPPPKQTSQALVRMLSFSKPAKNILCSAQSKQRMKMPFPFDMGYDRKCPGYVNINDDDYCDYCRVVGSGNILACTLGTAEGLTRELPRVTLERGGPYDGECGWEDYQNKGIPAFWHVVGDSHDQIATNLVKPEGIESAFFRPNDRKH